MTVHRRVPRPPNITIISTHLYTWVERGIVRVKCLAQKTQQNVPGQSSNPDHSIWKKLTNHEASPCINKHLMTGPKGNSHWVFCYTSPLKNKKKLRRNRLLEAGWLTNLPQFQGARPDHMRVERSSCCFPRELMSFDPRHVTCFPL